MRVLVLAFLAFSLSLPVLAVEPGEILADPVLERRARDISKNLRCLVCQNQSIDDSNADLARDLRVLVRERLVMGDSDSAVIRYIVARYGDYVLLNPPFKGSTYVLWIGPGVIFAFGAAAVFLFLRRRRSLAPPPLTEDEAKRIEALMDDKSQ